MDELLSAGPTPWFSQGICGQMANGGALPKRADVVVIGGGIMGVATCYWLSCLGFSVVVIEARSLGWGASGRNAGFMLCGANGIQSVSLIRSVLEAERIEAGFETPGHLALTMSGKMLEIMTQEVAHRPLGAPPLHVLDRAACEDVMKMKISPQFLGGRWLPDGGTIHPVRFLYGLVEAARRRGAIFVQDTKALQIETGRAGNRLNIRTDRGRIGCFHAVVAANSRSGELLDGLGAFLVPARGQVLCTEPMKPFFKVGLAVDWGTLYWRQCDDGAIVLGGYRGKDPQTEATSIEDVNPVIQSALTDFLPSAFPGVPPIQVARRWAGIMDDTPDNRPIVGQWPSGSNTWVIAGFGGHGLPPALGAAQALANAIAEGRETPELNSLSPARSALALSAS